jgi:hypothetical protein
MSFTLPNEVINKLNQLQDLNNSGRSTLTTINQKRNPNDVQHQVLFVSLVRVLKYFDGYLILAKGGYGEPAACVLRSVYEASLWMRWSLINKENAQKYFDGSKGEALRMAEKVFSRGLAQLRGAPDQEEARQLIKSSIKSLKLPPWEDLARDCGQYDLHVLIYPMLSAMSHGSMLFLGERVLDDKSVSKVADEKNIEPFIPIANNVLRDCIFVCHEWIVNGRLHPVPDIRKLMTQNS